MVVRTGLFPKSFIYSLYPDEPKSPPTSIGTNFETFDDFSVDPLTTVLTADGSQPQRKYHVKIISEGSNNTNHTVNHRSIRVPNLQHADPTPGDNPVITVVDFMPLIGATLLQIDVVPRSTLHGFTDYDIFFITAEDTLTTNYTLTVVEADIGKTFSDTDVISGPLLAAKCLERNRDGVTVYNTFIINAGS